MPKSNKKPGRIRTIVYDGEIRYPEGTNGIFARPIRYQTEMRLINVKNRKKAVSPLLWVLLGVIVAADIALTVVVLIGRNSSGKDPAYAADTGFERETRASDTVKPQESADDAQTGTEEEDPERKALLDECRRLERGYFYDEAIEKLEAAGELANDDTAALLEQIRGEKDALVPYEGQVFHVFFHSLIADTSKAFDGDSVEAGYNMYMTTVSEFKAMLPLLEEGGYVLYDITDLVSYEDGKVSQKQIFLPEGKKPLVLSVDDVNYYDYMRNDGFALRMDVDENGRVVTVMPDETSETKVTATYDGDVFPILDCYVDEHPEFSWRGAKGIAALTGYQGAFGYRITDLEDYDEATQKWMLGRVKAVAQALRDSGWQIASHSYTHNQYWNDKTMTMSQLQYDTGRWLGEIMPYVGETHIIISPFGVAFDYNDERFAYLRQKGFYIYCPVYSGMTTDYYSDVMVQTRLNLDGLTMMKYPERISKYFFDPADVLDPARPPMK